MLREQIVAARPLVGEEEIPVPLELLRRFPRLRLIVSVLALAAMGWPSGGRVAAQAPAPGLQLLLQVNQPVLSAGATLRIGIGAINSRRRRAGRLPVGGDPARRHRGVADDGRGPGPGQPEQPGRPAPRLLEPHRAGRLRPEAARLLHLHPDGWRAAGQLSGLFRGHRPGRLARRAHRRRRRDRGRVPRPRDRRGPDPRGRARTGSDGHDPPGAGR